LARKAVKAWQRCQRDFLFWPRAQLNPITKQVRYTKPKSDFSEAFNNDVKGMIEDAVKAPLRRSKRRRPIKAVTAKARAYTLYRMASVLAEARNVTCSAFQSLAETVNPAAVEETVDKFMERGAKEFSGDLHRMVRSAHTVAKYWAKLDKDQLQELRNIQASVAPPDAPAKKNVDLLQRFSDRRMREKFLLLPELLMKKLLRKSRPTRSDAVKSQLITAWALLCSAPMRVSNLVALADGVGVIDVGTGKRRLVRIHVPADQVKNDRQLDFTLGVSAIWVRDQHNRHFRALLTSQSTQLLFPGRLGSETKRAANLSTQLAGSSESE
jgi:hypothetical protein